MVIEHGTKAEMEECAFQACLPRARERWLMLSGFRSIQTPVELTVEHATSFHVRVKSSRFHYDMKHTTWFDLLCEGRLKRL